MSRDRLAVAVMGATGARYRVALAEVDRRRLRAEVDAYMEAVRALPVRSDGDPPRCVTCLAPTPRDKDHVCSTPRGRA